MNTPRSNKRWWMLWLALCLLLGGVLTAAVGGIHRPDAPPGVLELRALLLPGPTTRGHHQIELDCAACHARLFPSGDELQERCEACHLKQLKAAEDKHPKAKFTDPRNAERAALLDATRCVTCHQEHKPGITLPGALTLQKDYCVICHKGIAKDRPSHAGMGFDSCTDAGCHNYHDNTGLYEDFLLKHADGGFLLPTPRLPERDFRSIAEELSDYPYQRYPLAPLGAYDADHGQHLRSDPAIAADWLATAHAAAGVNCSACHQLPAAGDAPPRWVEAPDEASCARCHGPEVEGFHGGLHGMRLKQGLSPMTPAQAQLPMKRDALHETLGCTSCHGAHRFDSADAAVDACLGCHDDRHSRAYTASPHFDAWKKERDGLAAAGSGVSCATCHLPRVEYRSPDYVKRTLVEHNQSANLVPPIKMARGVCLNCHGLGFAIDALADAGLRQTNFRGRPEKHVPSIDMALAREREPSKSPKQH